MDNYILLYGIVGVLVTIYFDLAIKSNLDTAEPLSTRELVASVLFWPIVICVWVYAFFFSNDQDLT
jgi:heme/copper-type cytochrome/quinol oxidase subunit 3